MERSMRIEGSVSSTRPDRRALARHWAEKILSAVDENGAFKDPELEQEYQEWIQGRKVLQ